MGRAPLFGPFVPRNLDHQPPNVPSPTNDLLQIMPWPVFDNMTDRDLRAIYEFLSAIPCLEGGVAGRCGP